MGRMLRLALLSTLVASSLAAEFSTTASFTVKVGKTKKTASCDITISYDGAVVSQADSSVSWAKKSALNFAKTLSFTMGDASADVFTADVSLTLTKAKNKPPSAVKTSIDSTTSSPLA